jgi:CheY-like chemotaxis protein
MPSQKILFVEDDLALGELFMTIFEKTGHGATWFVRARASKGGLVLMDANGVECLLSPGRFELALVDYRLKGSALDGPEVTSHLVAAGIPVVGISGLQTLNNLLVKAGARGAVVKDDLFSSVLRRKTVITRDFTG